MGWDGDSDTRRPLDGGWGADCAAERAVGGVEDGVAAGVDGFSRVRERRVDYGVAGLRGLEGSGWAESFFCLMEKC